MATKRFATLALAGAMLLGACGQQTVTSAPVANQPVTAPTTPAKTLGLYELHISAAGGKLSSNVTRVGGGKLSAQEISGLTFSAAAAANTNDASGKHYAVAITVNNGSGKDINQPLYVPVAVTGYSQNETYFRSAKDSAGTDSDPTGVTIEQADAATPLIATSVSPSLISVPAGMTVSKVSGQAWQAPTLTNGASQTVTFGFNIPDGNSTYSFNVVFGVFATPKVNNLVISEAYTTGGNSGATYNADYVELFNPTNGDISLAGLSLQYGSATGTSTANGVNALPSVSIAPGKYFLVRLAGGSNGVALPVTPDYTAPSGSPAPIGLGAAAGKIALAKGTAALDMTKPQNFIDFLGYGTSNTAEGAGYSAASNTASLTAATAPAKADEGTNVYVRLGKGCTDNNNNKNDFSSQPVSGAPRNSASPVNLCQ